MEEEQRNSISTNSETQMESSTLRFFAQARKPFSPPESPPPPPEKPISSSTVRFLPGEKNPFSDPPPLTESPPPPPPVGAVGNENPTSKVRFLTGERKQKFYSPPQSPSIENENPTSHQVRFLPGDRNPFSDPHPLTESPPPPVGAVGNENPTSKVRFLTGERQQKFYSPPQSPLVENENPTSHQVRIFPGERKKTFFSPPQSPIPVGNENPTSPVRFLPEEEKPLSPSQPPPPPPPENTQSPLRFFRKEKKPFSPPPPESPLSKAIVPVDRRLYEFSPPEQKPFSPPPPETPLESIQGKNSPPVFMVNRSIREELSVMGKTDRNGEDGYPSRGGRREDIEDGNERKPRHLSSIIKRDSKEEMIKRVALGFRVCAVIFCLISFSVMAADKTQGWAGDSFDRYKEYRYCISVTIIGFVYSGFQAFDLAYNLVTENHIIPRHIGYYFDFSMDQIMTYLLISASSSAATRVDDWQTNWGKDKFTEMATGSIGMSFMAFFSFAFSSLISGYNLCTHNYH